MKGTSVWKINTWNVIPPLIQVGQVCAAVGLVLPYPKGLECWQTVDQHFRHKVPRAAESHVGYHKCEQCQCCIQLEAFSDGILPHGAQQPVRLLDGAALIRVLLVGLLQ